MFLVISIILIIIMNKVIGEVYLKYMSKIKYNQPIYELSPETHQKKVGTPTMGAISFLIPIILYVLYLIIVDSSMILIKFILLIAIVGFSLIGLFDDLSKIKYSDNQHGLSPKQKLIFQFFITSVVLFLLYINGISTTINFIFMEVDFGVFYFIIMLFLFMGFSNASNITDGLDGLLGSVTVVLYASLYIVAVIQKQFIVSYVILAFVVSLLCFVLFFNKFKAKMFMGDTGSLAIGAMFVLFSIILKVEFIAAISAVIYLVEMFSVIIQTSYYKYTKKKYQEPRRVFLMAPLHHHYEKKGLNEKKIVFLFCSIQVISSLLFIFIAV